MHSNAFARVAICETKTKATTGRLEQKIGRKKLANKCYGKLRCRCLF